jgi:ribosomal protein S18 acetylase RimI-like enzyme
MVNILKDFAPESLIVAIKANLFEYYDYLGRSPKAELYESPYLKLLLTGIPHLFLNNVLRTQLRAGNVDEVIQQTLTNLRSRNVTKLSWWTEPGTQPEDLGAHLVSHGLEYTDGGPGMAVDLLELKEGLTPSDLTIKRVEEAETLRDFVQAAVIGFGLPDTSEPMCFDLLFGLGFDPPLRNYVGYLHGEPIATSESFLGAGVAGIYWVSTVPEARRQGIGSAMTQAPLREAREMGYRVGILHSAPLGLGVYRRLGFVEYCRMSHYVWESDEGLS